MALRDLSSRDLFLRALSEFDQLGRDAFLTKYGFGSARSYELLHNGRHDDPKAIIVAAHGYQFLDRGPLQASEFSGGEQATGYDGNWVTA